MLFGAILTVGGVAGSMAAINDVSTGRATVGDVVRDIGIFIEGWIAEMIAPTYDAGLEKAHAYALFILLIPGLLLLFFNLVPFFKRGMEFQVHPDGSVSVRRGDSWDPLMDYQYSTVRADGTTIEFRPPPEGQRGVLPAATGRPGLRHRVGVGQQHQLHRYPEVTGRLSGRLDSCSW